MKNQCIPVAFMQVYNKVWGIQESMGVMHVFFFFLAEIMLVSDFQCAAKARGSLVTCKG